ncbi:hypothetical protein GR01_21580 [Mycobacteroides chelonae]|nr:hypothetical protein GR01_21580 [Mycobacteroides chelonae]
MTPAFYGRLVGVGLSTSAAICTPEMPLGAWVRPPGVGLRVSADVETPDLAAGISGMPMAAG